MLYTAKGIASWLAGFGAAAIASYFKSWNPVFYLTVLMNLIAGFLGIYLLKKIVSNRILTEKS